NGNVAEEGNFNNDMDYDQWLMGISSEKMKKITTTLKNSSSEKILLNCLLYGEAAGPPFNPSKLQTEYIRKKID
ncbi:1929_t:CDS:1, partial [Entrophospora sp. SA101]